MSLSSQTEAKEKLTPVCQMSVGPLAFGQSCQRRLTFGDDGPRAPPIRPNPVEVAGGVHPLDRLHQLGHLLVRPKDDDTYGKTFYNKRRLDTTRSGF